MNVWDVSVDVDWDPPGAMTLQVRTEDCEGSDCDFTFRLPLDVALQLYRGVTREMAGYVHEMEEARAAFNRGDDRWKPREVIQAEAQDLLDSGVYDHDIGKRIATERIAQGEA